jgi:predicted transcriptional regulator
MLNTGPTSDSNRLLEKSRGRLHHSYQLSDSQHNILKAISQYPGIRYKELARKTDFANGVLTYNLNILEQFGYVNRFRHNNITRYYPLSIPGSDLKIISHLRVYSEKDIILFLLSHDFCTFNEIVEHLGKAPSTVSWHLKRLCEDGILVVRHGKYNLYQINGKELVNQLLHKYKESFTDRIVNNFSNIVDEL